MLSSDLNLRASGKPVFIGAALAFVLIIVFLLPVLDEPDSSWPVLWMIRPLVIVPLAGAAGGFFFFLMTPLRKQGGWRLVLANVISFFVYLVGLWLGTVLGLAGTLWH
ncbi:MAG: potassium transporter KefB [Bacteroidota bacterium]